MKEYFQKIVAWVKAHPWAAAGILGVIVLIIYFAIKNNWFGGGGGGGGEGVALPEGGGGAAVLPGSNTTPDTTPLPDVTSLPGLGNVGQSSNPIPVSMPGIGNYLEPLAPVASPVSYPVDMSYAGGASMVSPASQSLADVSAPSPSAVLGGGLGSSFFSGNLSYNTQEEIPSQIVSAGQTSTKAKSKGKKSGGNKTPAQEAGKGAKFTGYINGVYYVNGYPAAASSIASQTTVTPSAGSMVSPAQGGGFFSGNVIDPTAKKSTKYHGGV